MADQFLVPILVLDTEPRSLQLAQQLCLPLVPKMPSSGLVLLWQNNGLVIVPADASSGAVSVDFVSGKHRHRRLYGGGKGQKIAKAVGIQGSVRPTILDVTAGLGGDAFVLASLGCQVSLVERHSIVRALLKNGLQRLSQEPDLVDVSSRLNFLPTNDALIQLNNWSGIPPQVVYIDPMFPTNKQLASKDKFAKVKKEMALFRTMVGADNDANTLLTPAFALASHRVVVKRPRLAPVLDDRKPTYSLAGKANRFDIYVKASLNHNP